MFAAQPKVRHAVLLTFVSVALACDVPEDNEEGGELPSPAVTPADSMRAVEDIPGPDTMATNMPSEGVADTGTSGQVE